MLVLFQGNVIIHLPYSMMKCLSVPYPEPHCNTLVLCFGKAFKSTFATFNQGDVMDTRGVFHKDSKSNLTLS